MIKSIIIQKDGKDSTGQTKYDLKAYEGKLMVHHVVFIDPEFAEYYAENYMINVWNGKEFYVWDTVH